MGSKKKEKLNNLLKGSISFSRTNKADSGQKSQSEVIDIFEKFMVHALDGDVKFPEKLYAFIYEHHELFRSLNLDQLIQLKNQFNHSLESLLFLIILLEYSKIDDNQLLREFTVFCSLTIHSKQHQSISQEGFYEMRDQYYTYGNVAESKYHELHTTYLKDQIKRTNQLLGDSAKIVFDTRFKFMQTIGTDHESKKLFEEILGNNKVGFDDKDLMRWHEAQTQILHFIRLNLGRETSMIQFQDEEAMLFHKAKINLALNISYQAGFEELETFKSAIFNKSLGWQANISKEQINSLPNGIQELLRQESNIKKKMKKLFLKEKDLDFDDITEVSKASQTLHQIYHKLEDQNKPWIQQYIRLSKGDAIKYNEIKALLKNHGSAALIEYFIHENELIIFALNCHGSSTKEEHQGLRIFKYPFVRQELLNVLERLNHEIALATKHNGFAPNAHEIDYFYTLGQQLLPAEVLEYVSAASHLYVIPFEELFYIPFHAFRYKHKYLIQQFSISYLPSATVLRYLNNKKRQITQKPGILALGVDAYDLENVFEQEVENIFEDPRWDKSQSSFLTGVNATKEKLLNHMNGKEIFHFSTHGFFNKVNFLTSGILLYCKNLGDLENSNISLTNDPDTTLSVKEISELTPSEGGFMAMTGCLTGYTNLKTGDELLGLSRALFYAGISSMILSVFDTIKNVNLNKEIPFNLFYKFWLDEHLGEATAFQRFINLIIQHPVYNHPFFWFNFIYMGK